MGRFAGRPRMARGIHGVRTARRTLVPTHRHHRVPGRRRQRRVLPALPVGRPRRIVGRRGPPAVRGDARLQPGVLRIPGRPLRPDGSRVLRKASRGRRSSTSRSSRRRSSSSLRTANRSSSSSRSSRSARRGGTGGPRAAVAGALAALTRSIGVVLAPALIVMAFERRNGRSSPWPRVLAGAAVLLGPLIYFGWWETGTRDRAGADPCTGQLATPRGLSAHDALERRQARGGPRSAGSELLADRRPGRRRGDRGRRGRCATSSPCRT